MKKNEREILKRLFSGRVVGSSSTAFWNSAIGGSAHYDIAFKIENEYCECIVKTENNKNGTRLKDGKKRNVTKDIISS